MRVIIDYDQCSAHGLCMERVPEVFRLEDDDTLTLLDPSPSEALRAAVEAAAEWCPKSAIRIEESPS